MTKVKAVMNKSIADVVNSDYKKAVMNKGYVSVANAAPSITPSNINLPLGALTYIRPSAIEVLTAPRMADKIAEAEKNGKWGDEQVNIKVKEYKGKTVADDGGPSDVLQVKTNYTNFLRGVYYYATGWMVNDIQEARVGAMAENYRADQVEGAMRSLAIDRNDMFFYGKEAKGQTAPIFGFLNDENLTPYVAVTAGAAATNPGYWANKTSAEIYNDFVVAMAQLNKQSNGKASEEVSMGAGLVLMVDPVNAQYLRRSDSTLFAKTPWEVIKQNYPTIELLEVPQLAKADSGADVFYLMVKPAKFQTVINSYVEMAKAYPIKMEDSQVSQKISAATSGCIVQYPIFIVRYTGIGA